MNWALRGHQLIRCLIAKGAAAAVPTTAGVPERPMKSYRKMPLCVGCTPPECIRINRVKDSSEEMLEPKDAALSDNGEKFAEGLGNVATVGVGYNSTREEKW
jgi:hypothetical protein